MIDEAQMPAPWLDGGARIAILCPDAQVVYASSLALALFGAKDIGELESRMLLGEGPSARRLRHLAATLPVGEAMRLERLRFFRRTAAGESQFALRSDRNCRRRAASASLSGRCGTRRRFVGPVRAR